MNRASKDDIVVDQGQSRWRIFERLREFFWGVNKKTPCLLGVTQEYVDHWMIGPHSWGPETPCKQ